MSTVAVFRALNEREDSFIIPHPCDVGFCGAV